MPKSKNKRRSGKKAFQRKEMDRSLRARVRKYIPDHYVEEVAPRANDVTPFTEADVKMAEWVASEVHRPTTDEWWYREYLLGKSKA